MTDTHYFRHFACCLPVKGATRSLICDIQRNHFDFIPNALFEIITEDCKNKSVGEIFADYGQENEAILREYFDFLIEKEYGFWCEDKEEMERFPDLDLHWDYPAHITNAIIDVNEGSEHSFQQIFSELEGLLCKDIQIRCFCEKEISFWQNVGDLLEDSIIKSVQVITKYTETISTQDYIDLLKKYFRIASITVHSAPFQKIISAEIDSSTNVIYTKEIISDANHCGIIHPAYFTLNIETFTESQKHNSCLNRKIGIDVNGNIKNCPSLTKIYGNIKSHSLKEVIEKEGFKDVWIVNKDQISVCKDCEFRYICTDCRAFVENALDKPKKCNYNPYTATWE